MWKNETSKEKVKDRPDYFLNGCKYKTGCCSKRCKCKKAGRVCGPSCLCINCANTCCYSECWDEEVKELEAEGQVDDICEYADESEDEDMATYEDKNTNLIMKSVLGHYDDGDCNEDNTS